MSLNINLQNTKNEYRRYLDYQVQEKVNERSLRAMRLKEEREEIKRDHDAHIEDIM